MYGVAGERRLAEWEADWLPGYEGSAPVRIGNAAVNQRQLDVYGEVIDAITLGQAGRPELRPAHLGLLRALLGFLEKNWTEPDEGIWEVRGPRRHFVHSKVMAWVAFDRAIRMADLGLPGREQQWRAARDQIHAEVCEQGYDAEPRHLHAVLRQLRAGRGGAADSRGRLPARGRPAGDLHGRDHPARAGPRWPGAQVHPAGAAAAARRPSTACPAARAPSWPAVSGWPTRCR